MKLTYEECAMFGNTILEIFQWKKSWQWKMISIRNITDKKVRTKS